MCTLYLFWWLRFWDFLRSWHNRRQEYAPLAVDLDDFARGGRDRASLDIRQDLAGPKWLLGRLIAYSSLVLLGIYMLCTHELPSDHRFKPRVQLANRVPKREGYGTGEKIFIAASFYNNELVLPYWTTEITKLINYLGSDNVFVSIVESYSSDNSPALLRKFDQKLEVMGVPHRILTQDTSITRPAPAGVSISTSLARIEFLAAVRNLVMEPLVAGGGYDRVLFSNDVFVQSESMVELLSTRDGDYDMACALDFHNRGLYDLWVLRDRLGRLTSALWPYFLEDTGFRAVMAEEPAPVFTCWNGIVSILAEPFLPIALRHGRLSTSPLPRPLPPSHPAYPQWANVTPALTPPLVFRASAPNECFSSESFNLPYDLRRQFALEKIYVNPRVLTAYLWRYYLWFKIITRHWAVKWFMETVEKGDGIDLAKLVLGNPADVWPWDGGDCQPQPFG
ncbi:cryptococcal mannosyltransferase 1-domain-containing protein [Mycena rosella]|uniref:Cryptococcal mannosyltransferase 1-domain-containing protein n=1 Tax=Mycena rosella TaxID=1033263 RepID=A0AAD7DIB2_MYCRO|nr:cryptococcal mannosyltransferase 1-domain-containing protein [Mycena rosella]